MYRQYEDPHKLKADLEEAKKRLKRAVNAGADDETIISLADDVLDIKERINFAYQDEENDMD